jgi:hypothetical protein
MRAGLRLTLTIEAAIARAKGADNKEISLQDSILNLSLEASSILVTRYYFMNLIQKIVASYGMSQLKVKNMLHRICIALKSIWSRRALKYEAKEHECCDEFHQR